MAEPSVDLFLARLSTRTIHIIRRDLETSALCGESSNRWRRGFIRDERVMCKKCLKLEERRDG